MISAAREQKATMMDSSHLHAEVHGETRRRERKTVHRFSPNDGTIDTTTTRFYTPMRPYAERNYDLLTDSTRRRVNISIGAQLGTKLFEMMREAAEATPGGSLNRFGDG